MRPFADLPPLRIGATWRGDHRPALAALLVALPKFPPARRSI